MYVCILCWRTFPSATHRGESIKSRDSTAPLVPSYIHSCIVHKEHQCSSLPSITWKKDWSFILFFLFWFSPSFGVLPVWWVFGTRELMPRSRGFKSCPGCGKPITVSDSPLSHCLKCLGEGNVRDVDHLSISLQDLDEVERGVPPLYSYRSCS